MQEYFHLNLTNSFKDIIQKNGLVDTGLLLGSIRVYVKQTGTVLTYRLGAVDYFKYLVEPFRLIEQWIESSRFKIITEDITEEIINSSVGQLLVTGKYDPVEIPDSVEIDIFYY